MIGKHGYFMRYVKNPNNLKIFSQHLCINTICYYTKYIFFRAWIRFFVKKLGANQ